MEFRIGCSEFSPPPKHIMATTQHSQQEAHTHRDALQLYLREIGKVPLLTREEEVQLSIRIRKGDEAARSQMIQANLRLVVKIANDYSNLGLPLPDLISEGNIGLMKAVDRFDPNKGAKLSTYGAWWIKQSIKRALANQGKTIRLPVHVVDTIGRMRRARMQLTEEFGREPTDDELAVKMELPRAKIEHYRTISHRPASLNTPLPDGDAHELGDLIGDDKLPSPYDWLRHKAWLKEVRHLLCKLSERESSILLLRFGLDGKKPRTLDQVGKKFNLTRERIRQIQNMALTKLRRIIDAREQTGQFSNN